jgi:hypothetical protein
MTAELMSLVQELQDRKYISIRDGHVSYSLPPC